MKMRNFFCLCQNNSIGGGGTTLQTSQKLKNKGDLGIRNELLELSAKIAHYP